MPAVDVNETAHTNEAFRRVLITGSHAQVVVMAIPVGGEIGDEVHPDTDQVLLFEEGCGRADVEGRRSSVGPGDLVFVRAGTRHVENRVDLPILARNVYRAVRCDRSQRGHT